MIKIKDILEKAYIGEEAFYSLNKIKQTVCEIVPLKDGYLVLNLIDDVNIGFALFFIDGCDNEDEYLELIFYGEGVGSDLRECRHTYWGEAGYIFCMPLDLIKEAMIELAKYFDC